MEDQFNQILDFEEKGIEIKNHIASKGNRFANYILDSIVINTILLMVTTYSIASGRGITLFEEYFYFCYILFAVPYYTLFEYIWGKSPAKFITRTIVVEINGKRPSFLTILARSISRLIPFEAFSFFGKIPRGWHDTITETYVIYEEGLGNKLFV